MFRFPEGHEPDVERPRPQRPPEEISLTFTEQLIDQAVNFARTNRTRVAWRDWAQSLAPHRRAAFEAIREGGKGRDGESLPNFDSLPHELRMMLDEAYRVWGLVPSEGEPTK